MREARRRRKRDRDEQNSVLSLLLRSARQPLEEVRKEASNTKRTSDYPCIEETEQTGGARACRATSKWKSEHSITSYLAFN